MQYPQIPNSHALDYPKEQDSALHKVEISKLARSRKKAWIQLDATMIETRYNLQLEVLDFKPLQTPTSIQSRLHDVCSSIKHDKTATSLEYFFLVAQKHVEEAFYEISEYINRCLAGDLSVAERLIGRTILYIYEIEKNAFDLLSDNGAKAFIEHYFVNYIQRFGVEDINGFIVEMPRFLSVLDVKQSSIPWSRTIMQNLRDENGLLSPKSTTYDGATFLPFLFYETYDSPIIRSYYWQTLFSQFSNCFLKSLKEFCHQQGIRFALAVRESARSLQFDLGTLLEHVDLPILTTTEGDTSRRFTVSKYVCSKKTQPGIKITREDKLTNSMRDVSIGFNHWITEKSVRLHSEEYEHETMAKLLQVGSPKRDILMLAPTQSLWMKPDEKQWNSIIKSWGWFCKSVWYFGYDFDILSENQLVNATVNPNNGNIHFGENVYHLVLLPSSISLHETSVQRLTEYTKYKGRIIANAPVPYLLNGRIGLEPYLLERLIYRRQTTILDGPENEREIDLKKYLNNLVSQSISVYAKETDLRSESVRIHKRQDGKRFLYFLMNIDKKPIETLIEIVGVFNNVEGIRLQTGKKMSIEPWHANGNTYLNHAFKPENGSLFILS